MRKLAIGIAALVVLALLAFGLTYPRLQRLSDVGTGYVAMQVCNCVEVAGRPYADCLLDMLPEMDAISSEPTTRDGKSGIRAWIPLYADRTALREPPNACTLY